jgi:hypothetical protein
MEQWGNKITQGKGFLLKHKEAYFLLLYQNMGSSNKITHK